jgi:hypothetical protein
MWFRGEDMLVQTVLVVVHRHHCFRRQPVCCVLLDESWLSAPPWMKFAHHALLALTLLRFCAYDSLICWLHWANILGCEFIDKGELHGCKYLRSVQ